MAVTNLRDLTYNEYGIPNDPALAQQVGRQVGAMTNAAVSVPLSLFAPDTQESGPVPLYAPGAGAVEYGAGLLNTVGTQAATLLSAATKPTLGVTVTPPPAWLGELGQRYQQSKDAIQSAIDTGTGGLFSKPDLHTAEGRVEDIVGGAAGSAIGVPAAAAPVVAGIGLAGGAADLAFHPPGDTTAPSGPPTSIFGTQAAPDQPTPQAVAPTADAAAPSIFGTQPVQPTAPVSIFGSPPPVGPTFTQQGETGTSIGEAAVGLGLALLGVMAGRFTHSYGAAIDTTARDARFADPAYAQAVQDYQNDVISRGPNSGTLLPPGGTPTPAPTPQGTPVRQATTIRSRQDTEWCCTDTGCAEPVSLLIHPLQSVCLLQ